MAPDMGGAWMGDVDGGASSLLLLLVLVLVEEWTRGATKEGSS